jgi:ribulose 1,5-bisphosphate carboxylase large subunit-like protein
MATINASISVSSDIMSYPISINKSMQIKKLASCHGLDETTGLRTKKFGTVTTAATIVEHDELTDDKAHMVYIRNTTSNKANFFYVAYNASAAAATTTEVIGKLYGGDWMLFPYNGNTNITVASDGGIEQTLEYMVFADGIVAAAG